MLAPSNKNSLIPKTSLVQGKRIKKFLAPEMMMRRIKDFKILQEETLLRR